MTVLEMVKKCGREIEEERKEEKAVAQFVVQIVNGTQKMNIEVLGYEAAWETFENTKKALEAFATVSLLNGNTSEVIETTEYRFI